ncbi:DUF1800 domain-containing protein [Virgisporangium aliadipatigenens]|uniref:DUF1800 domain-containing protein n=1 Tax=Virgisporangium aliadipatigenens TaxID=741659 RepID=UPI001940F471|nr:DUF1800 domain-containing protein [Virgisporangium aliadipatigenens]
MTTREDVAHLLRRATFGPRAMDLDEAERIGFGATLDGLLTQTGPTPGTDPGAERTPVPPAERDPYAVLPKNADGDAKAAAVKAQKAQVVALTSWWVNRMVSAEHQAREKLTFFWHGHWATSAQKVRSANLMRTQQQTLYRLAGGDFGPMVHAMVRDPALIYWLDGQRNSAAAPNENLARELMELFTLGIGNYSEADVKEGARALTGWQLDRVEGTASFSPKRFDSKPKTILGKRADHDADDFVELLLAHPATAKFVTARLWFRYASGEPVPAQTHERLVAAYGAKRDITAALRAMFTDPAFAATRGQLVKQPVEWAVGAMRQLGVEPGSWKENDRKQLNAALDALGQVPFAPPSVGGWPAGAAWLTTSTTQVRLGLANRFANNVSPATLDAVASAPAAGRPDALARLLAVESFSTRTRAVLLDAGNSGKQADLRRQIALALASPEYCVQ